jgi:glc operon protein GlcG
VEGRHVVVLTKPFVPRYLPGQCIGGVGVSGGDWETDLRIAKAAVESIGMGWK